jgi:hypothetical protein
VPQLPLPSALAVGSKAAQVRSARASNVGSLLYFVLSEMFILKLITLNLTFVPARIRTAAWHHQNRVRNGVKKALGGCLKSLESSAYLG